MAPDLSLGIDLGTTSVKVLLVDSGGRVVGRASAGYPLHTPRPGWVEQDPDDWWQATCSALRQAARQVDPARIRGLSLSGQLNGGLFLDEALQPLRPVPIWLDHRAAELCRRIDDGSAGDRVLQAARQRLTPVNTLAKILWVRDHEPAVYRKTRVVVLPKDWLRLRLSGSTGTDLTDASVTAALDLKEKRWSSEALAAVGVREDLFPPLSPSTEVVGAVTEAAAASTGLPAGLPVCAGGGDMPCLAVGSGVVRPGIVSLGIGTAAHATAYAPGLETASGPATEGLWPMCHPDGRGHAWLGCSFTGGESLRWLTGILGAGYEGLLAEAEQAEAGSGGLVFAPWLEGRATPGPDPAARGAFLGLDLRHGRGHMVRAVMEGVAYDLRECLECFRCAGLPDHEIRIGEGGLRSVLWRQIVADVVGAPVRVLAVEDLSALGAALIAAVGTGLFEDFEEACGAGVRLAGTVEPRDEARAAYEEGFVEYQQIYPALRDWHGGRGP